MLSNDLLGKAVKPQWNVPESGLSLLLHHKALNLPAIKPDLSRKVKGSPL